MKVLMPAYLMAAAVYSTAFDASPDLIGTTIRNVTVRSVDELDAYVEQYHPDVAVLTVPQHVAQSAADRCIALGIRGFWNFTNVELCTQVPGVFFENVHFVDKIHLDMNYVKNVLT